MITVTVPAAVTQIMSCKVPIDVDELNITVPNAYDDFEDWLNQDRDSASTAMHKALKNRKELLRAYIDADEITDQDVQSSRYVIDYSNWSLL